MPDTKFKPIRDYALFVGTRVENWLILEDNRTGETEKTKGRKYFLCRCLEPGCGGEKLVGRGDLVNGRSKNCGCTRKKDATGKKFGLWEVLRKIGIRNGEALYLCRCGGCGNEHELIGSHLRSGKTLSCGCVNKISTIDHAKRSAIHGIYSNNERGYSKGDLTEEEFGLLIQLPCYYCGRIGVNHQDSKSPGRSKFANEHSNIHYNGIDRFNTSVAEYNRDNAIPSCPNCNFFKLNRNYEDMLAHIPHLKDMPETKTVNQLHRVKNDAKNLADGAQQPRDAGATSILGKLYPKRCESNTHGDTSFVRYCVSKFLHHRKTSKRYEKFREVELTDLDVAELKLGDCVFCGKEANLDTNDINEVDRIDPSIGYTIENCTPACRYCNSAKARTSLSEFKEWVRCIKSNLPNLPPISAPITKMLQENYFVLYARENNVPNYFKKEIKQ